MKTEQQQLNAMYDRVKQVFPEAYLNTLAPQQETLINSAIHRVVQKDGPDSVTLDRLEGIKELVTQHLWSDALTTSSARSQASATETSETSDSTPTKSNGSDLRSLASRAPIDLQNLPQDPALGAIDAMQSRLQEQSTSDDKQD